MSPSWRSVSRWSRRLRQSDETWVGSIHFGGFASVDVSPLHSTDVGVCRKFVVRIPPFDMSSTRRDRIAKPRAASSASNSRSC